MHVLVPNNLILNVFILQIGNMISVLLLGSPASPLCYAVADILKAYINNVYYIIYISLIFSY